MENEFIRAGEFERSHKSVMEAINTGFERMDSRFDNVEKKQDDHGARLAVLEDWRKNEKRKTQVTASTWGAGGAAVAGFVIALGQAFGFDLTKFFGGK